MTLPDDDTVPMDKVPRRPFLKSAISRRVESVRVTICGPAVEDFAGVGQGDAARLPLQELDAQFFFQGLHLLAQRRLGHVKAPGGGCDLAFFGDDHEISELTDIHTHASLTYDLHILYQLYKYFQYSKRRVILRP